MFKAKTFARQFLEELLDRVALVKFLVPRAAGRSIFGAFDYGGVAFFLARKSKVQVRVFFSKLRQILAVMEIINELFVALTHLHEVLGQLVGMWMTMVEVGSKIPAFAAQSVGVFIQCLQKLQDFAQLLFREY